MLSGEFSNEDAVLDTVGQLYDAATDLDDYGRLSATLSRAFETDRALIIVNRLPDQKGAPPQVESVVSGTDNFDGRAREAYARHYIDHDLWYAEALKRPLPFMAIGQELVSDTVLVKSEIYDFMRMTGIFHALGTQFTLNENLAGVIAIYREQTTSRHFDEFDKLHLTRLLPHIRRALLLQHRLGAVQWERNLTLDILEQLSVGVVVVDAKCRILFNNSTAERILRDEPRLRVIDGRLHIAESADAFTRLVAEAARTSRGEGLHSGGTVNVDRESGAPLQLLIAPLRSRQMGFGYSAPAAIVVFSGPEARFASEAAIAQKFSLTPAETRLLVALADGRTVAQHAEAQGITVGTARIYLKSVLSKSGYHRQVDLVRALASDPLMRLAANLSPEHQ